MEARRAWMSVFALITFVMGGLIIPVLHRVDHAAEWYDQQAAAHRHGQPASDSVGKACSVVAADQQDCHFCQRNVISDLVPARAAAPDFRTESLFAAVPHGTTPSLDAFSPIRAPPVTA